jgi:AcrR family transcriptional regulator
MAKTKQKRGEPAVLTGLADEEALAGFTGRQRELLEAALKVMSRKGYEGSRTREIAREAGVSEATLFKNFPTKRHLLRALMLPFVATVIKPAMMSSVRALIRDAADGPLDQLLRDIMRDRLRLFRAHMPLLTTLILEAVRQPDLLEIMRTQVVPEVVDILDGVLNYARSRGELGGIDRLVFIRAVLSLLMGYLALSELFPGLLGGDGDENAIVGMVGLLLHGAGSRKEGRQ